MLPELRAEDALRAIKQTGVGTGALKKEDVKEILDDWYEALRPSHRPARAQKMTPAQVGAAKIGIGVVRQKRKRKQRSE